MYLDILRWKVPQPDRPHWGRRSVSDARVYQGAGDCNLMIIVNQLRLCWLVKKKSVLKKYEVDKETKLQVTEGRHS